MSELSRIGPASEPTVRPAASRPVTGRVGDAPVRRIDGVVDASERGAQGAPPLRIALGAGTSGVPGGTDALAAQLDGQQQSVDVAYGRADTVYRQAAGRLVEIMRAQPPLDLSI